MGFAFVPMTIEHIYYKDVKNRQTNLHDVFALVCPDNIRLFDFDDHGTYEKLMVSYWQSRLKEHKVIQISCGPKQHELDYLCSLYGWFVVDTWLQPPFTSHEKSAERVAKTLKFKSTADRLHHMVLGFTYGVWMQNVDGTQSPRRVSDLSMSDLKSEVVTRTHSQ